MLNGLYLLGPFATCIIARAGGCQQLITWSVMVQSPNDLPDAMGIGNILLASASHEVEDVCLLQNGRS